MIKLKVKELIGSHKDREIMSSSTAMDSYSLMQIEIFYFPMKTIIREENVSSKSLIQAILASFSGAMIHIKLGNNCFLT